MCNIANNYIVIKYNKCCETIMSRCMREKVHEINSENDATFS